MSGREETRGEFAAANLFPLHGEIDPKYVTGLDEVELVLLYTLPLILYLPSLIVF